MAEGNGDWEAAPAPDAGLVEALAAGSPFPLPPDYLAFLRESNGGEGELRVQPWWLVLWQAEDVLQYNRNYEVARNAPGFFAFGSSGGGEMFAFDVRTGRLSDIVAIPFIPMDPAEALSVAEDFTALLALRGESGEP
jgi:hypothetical protein